MDTRKERDFAITCMLQEIHERYLRGEISREEHNNLCFKIFGNIK